MRSMTYNVKHLWSIVSASTIRGEIVFAMAAFTVLPLLFATIYFFPRINDLVEDRLSKYGEELVTHTENSLRTAIHQTDFISQQITYWTVTHRLLTSSVDRPRHWVRAIQSTQQFVSNLTFAFPLLSGVFVVGEDGRVFTGTYSAHTSRLVEKPWIRAAIDAGRGEWVVPPHVVDYQDRLPTGPTETVLQLCSRYHRLYRRALSRRDPDRYSPCRDIDDARQRRTGPLGRSVSRIEGRTRGDRRRLGTGRGGAPAGVDRRGDPSHRYESHARYDRHQNANWSAPGGISSRLFRRRPLREKYEA